MATPSLGLTRDNRTRVFRKLVNLLKSDPVLSRVVKTWAVWDGDDMSGQEPSTGTTPYVRLTPRLGPMSWLSESDQVCKLTVAIEFVLEGFDADDPIDFQGAIEKAIYQTNQAQANCNALMSLGAETGLTTFDSPGEDPDHASRADGLWRGIGSFSIDVRRTLNP